MPTEPRPRGRPRAFHDKTDQNTVQALDRALGLLSTLAAAPGMTLSELAETSGQAVATVYRALVTLQGHAMVELEEPGQVWHIGPGAFRIGSAFLRRTKVVASFFSRRDRLRLMPEVVCPNCSAAAVMLPQSITARKACNSSSVVFMGRQLGAIVAAARAMSVLPIFSGLIGAAVTSGPPFKEPFDVLAPMSPPMTPPPSDIARTSRSATTRLPRGRAVGAVGGVLAQWESKLMS